MTITFCDRYDHANLQPRTPRLYWSPSLPGGVEPDVAEAFARELLARVAEVRALYTPTR